MSTFDITDHAHRRLNILTGEWVLVSPHRSKRPWQGKTEEAAKSEGVSYDPNCFLCPGNTRINGEVNPDYKDVFVFQNDFGALQADVPAGGIDEDDLFIAESEQGICRVICFSPDHSQQLGSMPIEGIVKVVKEWKAQYKELGSMDFINHVQIFENKGEIMGCSNPHPHGQIWAQKNIPNEVEKESRNQLAYYEKTGRSMLADYLAKELEKQERIIYENDHFVALVPFWAVWPFEAMIVSKRHLTNIMELTEAEEEGYADCLKTLAAKYDKVFDCPFPYSAGIHQAPTDGKDYPEWHLHMHFYPPLLRSATVKKFMVGYEMMAGPQRDITAEGAAKILREL
ncbi:UDP-glucose--hexose-1-phosphate uridylyltransferase [Reichenbachiella versicolor]|uniref:UDP-glucose--hexose-1-phosphate uridylyltransferase n=1 Tax=Reichenbachiella versicolor TaxID=1821036 RepID=UPI000D6E2B87|nr:UDP-glucose--hexose-1-phosphate uridylyltransferase [Reichenbachiella versicolor]